MWTAWILTPRSTSCTFFLLMRQVCCWVCSSNHPASYSWYPLQSRFWNFSVWYLKLSSATQIGEMRLCPLSVLVICLCFPAKFGSLQTGMNAYLKLRLHFHTRMATTFLLKVVFRPFAAANQRESWMWRRSGELEGKLLHTKTGMGFSTKSQRQRDGSLPTELRFQEYYGSHGRSKILQQILDESMYRQMPLPVLKLL